LVISLSVLNGNADAQHSSCSCAHVGLVAGSASQIFRSERMAGPQHHSATANAGADELVVPEFGLTCLVPDVYRDNVARVISWRASRGACAPAQLA
jgi:hypothetical protein